MNDLQKLITEYLIGGCDYSGFRRAMVLQFQSKRISDEELRDAVDAIGDAFVEFSEGNISESLLKNRVSVFLPSVRLMEVLPESPNSGVLMLSSSSGLLPANTLLNAPLNTWVPTMQIVTRGLSAMAMGAFIFQPEAETSGPFCGTQIESLFGSASLLQSSHQSNIVPLLGR